MPCITFTDKDDVRVKIWRTEDAGAIPYLITSGAQEIRNVTTASYVEFNDQMTDTTLITNEVLYTVGEAGNIQPPGARIMTQWGNRLWTVDDDNGLTIWFSKPMTDDLPPEFSDIMSFRVESVGGPIIALAALDDKLIVFKEDRLYYVVGQGPDASGVTGGSFSSPRVISSDVGCDNPKSVVRVRDQGIAFHSKKGIYLLDRGLNLSFIGAPVEGYEPWTIIDATPMEKVDQARWLLEGDESATGKTEGLQLVYDHYLRS